MRDWRCLPTRLDLCPSDSACGCNQLCVPNGYSWGFDPKTSFQGAKTALHLAERIGDPDPLLNGVVRATTDNVSELAIADTRLERIREELPLSILSGPPLSRPDGCERHRGSDQGSYDARLEERDSAISRRHHDCPLAAGTASGREAHVALLVPASAPSLATNPPGTDAGSRGRSIRGGHLHEPNDDQAGRSGTTCRATRPGIGASTQSGRRRRSGGSERDPGRTRSEAAASRSRVRGPRRRASSRQRLVRSWSSAKGRPPLSHARRPVAL